MSTKTMTHEEWRAEAVRLFGADPKKWRFVCPACGHVASVQDRLDVDARTAVAFSCVGRWTGAARPAFGAGAGAGPCNYAGGGLFGLNPVTVTYPDGASQDVFAFAEPEAA